MPAPGHTSAAAYPNPAHPFWTRRGFLLGLHRSGLWGGSRNPLRPPPQPTRHDGGRSGEPLVSTRDNGPVLDGWQVTGRCCGELHATVECSVCLNDVKPDLPLTPPNCVLGDN
jgi:hypothetical protein